MSDFNFDFDISESPPPSTEVEKQYSRREKMYLKMGLTLPPEGETIETFMNVVNAAYTAHTEEPREALSLSQVQKYCGHQQRTIARLMATPEFEAAMEKRGVSIKSESGLTTQQMLVMQLVLNPTDRRDLRTKLRATGVTYAVYKSWLRQPLFANYINRQAEQGLLDHQSDVLTKLTSKAMDGDNKSIELYLAITGRHNPAQQAQVNSQVMLLKVLEIITRNVKDPETLRAISAEFELMGAVGSGHAGNQTIRGELR